MNDAHEILIVEIPDGTKHPDADQLSIIVINGENLVINSEWSVGDRAVLIPADYLVPATPEFAFLGPRPKHRRIKPRRIRGVWSEALMLPAADLGVDHLPVGTNVMAQLGIERYDFENPEHNPQIGNTQDTLTDAPPGIRSHKYSLLSYKKYKSKLGGQHVRVTEKIHGTNSAYGYIAGKLYVGTRSMWVCAKESNSPQGRFIRSVKGIDVKEWCYQNPGKLLYGEVYGWVASLRYGHSQGELSFAAFDVWDQESGLWEGAPKSLEVPFLYEGIFDEAIMDSMVSGESCIPGANHIREGIVIEALTEPYDPHLGRLKMKYISNDYLASGK